MTIMDGRLDVIVSRDTLLASLDRADGPRVEFTVESMADSICDAFCKPRGLLPSGSLQRDIHRRQHLEIAQAIIDARKE